MKKCLLVLLAFFLFQSASAAYVKYAYDLTVSVSCADESKSPEEVKNVLGLSYVDSLLSISWLFEYKSLNFVLENKADQSMKIMWDDVSFMDIDGEISRVVHSGVKFIDKEKSMPPSNIPAGGKLTDLITPANNIYWHEALTEYSTSSWQVHPIIYLDCKKKEFQTLRDIRMGQYMKVILPIIINNKKYEYTFTFTISDVQLA